MKNRKRSRKALKIRLIARTIRLTICTLAAWRLCRSKGGHF